MDESIKSAQREGSHWLKWSMESSTRGSWLGKGRMQGWVSTAGPGVGDNIGQMQRKKATTNKRYANMITQEI